MDKKLEHFENFRLTPGSFDRYSNITPYTIFDIFQEVASTHAQILNAGFNKTNSKDIWLLLRSKYEIIQEITKPIGVSVKTWPLKPNRIDYEREYKIFDLDNNLLVKGTSKWILFDLESNQIRRTTFTFDGIYLEERNFPNTLTRINIPLFNKEDFVFDFKVTPSYLDINNHMNNAKYSIIVIDALNLKQTEKIKSIEFNFIKELKLDDIVSVYLKKIDDEFYCFGYIKDDIHFSSKIKLY